MVLGRVALSPLVYHGVGVLNMKGILGRMLYADDLAVVAENGWEMQEVLGEWKKPFGKQAG